MASRTGEQHTPPGVPAATAAHPGAAAGTGVVTRKPKKLTDMGGVLAWLDEHANLERLGPTRAVADALKLDRMRVLARALGDPHTAFKSVHVAGTKGKGSTCEMIAGCMEGCGYAVGIYTSPHLVDIRERIRINRAMVAESDFVRLAQTVAAAASELDPALGPPTFFELVTAMAFLHFAEQAVDLGVIEVGLGGRLDSTNIITPEVSAITSLSRDHWQILGDTIAKIAAEKAGIFKPGVPALTVRQVPEAAAVLRQVAMDVTAPLAVVGEDIELSVRFESDAQRGPHARVGITTDRNAFEHVPVPLMGEHQAVNCALALAVVDALTCRGFKAPEGRVVDGLATVRMPGRMELLNTSPRVLLDGAHNADSVKCLMKAVSAQVPYDSLVVIFGCAADKDIPGMLAELALGADKVIFTRTTGSARAADPADLVRRYTESADRMAQAAPTLAAALEIAGKGRTRGDLIVITGSLHLVGEAKRLIRTPPR